MDASGTYYGAGKSRAQDELVYYAGQDREFPIDSQLSIDVIRTAVKEFVASGGKRPTSIDWKPGRRTWPDVSRQPPLVGGGGAVVRGAAADHGETRRRSGGSGWVGADDEGACVGASPA
jgi:hypothetical protein